MSAADTALRVVRWAAAEGHPELTSPREDRRREPLPRGDYMAPEELLAPGDELRDALGELAAVTAARLRLGHPPLGDDRALGLDSLVLAFALGSAYQPALAAALLATLDRPANTWEEVVRHGLVAPALRFVPAALADECRGASPLTALLERPAGRQDAAALEAAERLRRHPAGRQALQLHLARPTGDPAVRRWRTRLLETLHAAGDDARDFVLEVYEATMVHHQDETLDQARRAREVFLDPIAAQDSDRLDDAKSAADWWGPLWAVERSDLGALRRRRYLGYAYREGLRIYTHGRKLRGL